MTPAHRTRLSWAAVLALVVLAVSTAPVFVSEGFVAGLGALGLSAIAPAVVVGIIASIWSANDRERAKATASRTW